LGILLRNAAQREGETVCVKCDDCTVWWQHLIFITFFDNKGLQTYYPIK